MGRGGAEPQTLTRNDGGVVKNPVKPVRAAAALLQTTPSFDRLATG